MANEEVTFVNVIDIEGDKAAEVVDLLKKGTESVISKRPGFISLQVLASKDGRRVVNIAKWKSPADAKATQSDPAAADFAKKIAALGTPSPGIYDLVGEYSA